MRTIAGMMVAAGIMAMAGPGHAASSGETPLPTPEFHIGDTWNFQKTREVGATGYNQTRTVLTVHELGGDTMTVGVKPDGAPRAFEDHVVGTDWSQRRLTNGVESVTTRPLTFPMKPGDTWTIDYVDATHRGNQLSDHVHRTYRVVGWQDVTVPAGTFHAMLVDARGVDEKVILVAAQAQAAVAAVPGSSTSISHAQRGGNRMLRLVAHEQLFYVPTVRNWVKSVEEWFNTDDVLVSRETQEMTAFTPGA